jgi:lysozyme
MIYFRDISQWQGDYNMAADPNPAIAIKMSGGDAGLYYDSKAALNYAHAVAAGKVVIGYHFAGGTDPIAEADFFIRAMSPLAENDVLCLDWEVHHSDPVGWCTQFVNHVHAVTGVWPLVYMNMSTANAHDWSPVFNNCGYWCAAPSFGFDETLPVKYPQVAQQGPIVNGVDTDAFFGTVEQLKKYGYHVQEPTPAPAPNPAPEPTPQPEPVPEPVPTPPAPEPIPTPTPSPRANPASCRAQLL